MRNRFAFVAIGAVAVVAVAIGQERVSQPGQLTQGRVWIENRGDTEAIPVTLRQVGRVQLVEPVAIAPSSTVQARAARQQWDYRMLTVTRGQDIAAALNGVGGDGWEAVGLSADQGNTVIVLKRPR